MDSRCDPSSTGRWTLFAGALSAVLLLSACASSAPIKTQGLGNSAPPVVRLTLPPSLESDRALYQKDIETALDRVDAWFSENGLGVDRREMLDSAVMFADVPEARRQMAKHFGLPEDKIPGGFSGTVDGRTLFLVSRETYAKTYARLYPDRSWSTDSFQSLVTHELAHRAHALKAKALFGSEEGMGPRWFFEGLAISCSSQFAELPTAMMGWQELKDLIAQDSNGVLSYPLYGRMFRSLAARFPVRWMVEHAAEPGFVGLLDKDYLPRESAR